MPFIDPNTLPYRSGVGIVLLNADGLVWIGRRFDADLNDAEGGSWQMPQGGIDENEEPSAAARRELYEETGIRSVEVLARSQDWIKYEIPPELVGKALKGKYRGQRQLWFAMRFLGEEDEINLSLHGRTPEFDAWRWATAREVLGVIVGFKRPAYEAVFTEFKSFIAA